MNLIRDYEKEVTVPDKFVVENAIGHECFLWVQILVESASDDRIGIDADTELLEHCVDVSAEFLLSSLGHEDECAATIVDVAPDILKLLSIKWKTRASQ